MAEINRVALFGKLNSLGYKAIESATVFCKLRGNPYVELAHWFNQILQMEDSDLHRIIKRFGLNPSRLASDVVNALDRLPSGATAIQVGTATFVDPDRAVKIIADLSDYLARNEIRNIKDLVGTLNIGAL